MNLHRIGVIATAAGDLARSVGSALDTIDRERRGPLSIGIAMLILGAGVAIGALATKPELRRVARDYVLGKERPATANGAATSASSVPAAQA